MPDPTRPQPPPPPTPLEAAITLLLRQLDEALAAYIATSGLAPAPATNAALGAMPPRLRLAIEYRGRLTPRQHRIIAHAHGPGWSGRYVRQCDLDALEAAGLIERREHTLDGRGTGYRVTELARELYVREPGRAGRSGGGWTAATVQALDHPSRTIAVRPPDT